MLIDALQWGQWVVTVAAMARFSRHRDPVDLSSQADEFEPG
jgi:hypothetical protein